jgi:hypothetical protein
MKKIKDRSPGRPKLKKGIARERLSISIHPNVKKLFDYAEDKPGRIIDKLVSKEFDVDISDNLKQDKKQ